MLCKRRHARPGRGSRMWLLPALSRYSVNAIGGETLSSYESFLGSAERRPTKDVMRTTVVALY